MSSLPLMVGPRFYVSSVRRLLMTLANSTSAVCRLVATVLATPSISNVAFSCHDVDKSLVQ